MASTSSSLRSTRARAAASALYDALTLVAWVGVGSLLATAWLFVRSSYGAQDIDVGDAQAGAAFVLAMPPAWLAWYARGILSGRTRGQARGGVEVEGTRRQRVLRFATHPLALPHWGWFTLVLIASGQPLPAIVALLVTGVVTLGAVVSFLEWLFVPGSRGVHDRIAGTRTVRAGEARS